MWIGATYTPRVGSKGIAVTLNVKIVNFNVSIRLLCLYIGLPSTSVCRSWAANINERRLHHVFRGITCPDGGEHYRDWFFDLSPSRAEEDLRPETREKFDFDIFVEDLIEADEQPRNEDARHPA